jgi:hypothetical protein
VGVGGVRVRAKSEAVGVLDARSFEEHHQIVIAVGGAEDLVPGPECTVTLRPPVPEGGCTTIGPLLMLLSLPLAGPAGEPLRRSAAVAGALANRACSYRVSALDARGGLLPALREPGHPGRHHPHDQAPHPY